MVASSWLRYNPSAFKWYGDSESKLGSTCVKYFSIRDSMGTEALESLNKGSWSPVLQKLLDKIHGINQIPQSIRHCSH